MAYFKSHYHRSGPACADVHRCWELCQEPYLNHSGWGVGCASRSMTGFGRSGEVGKIGGLDGRSVAGG